MSIQPNITHTVLVVDPHPIVHIGIADVLKAHPDFEVVGSVLPGPPALGLVKRVRPQLAVVELGVGQAGFEFIKDLRHHVPETTVLIYSAEDELVYAEPLLRCGAHGFLSKRSPAAELVKALRQLLTGEPYLSEPVKARLIARMAHGSRRTRVETLSSRELEVFRLLGEGFATSEIAVQLGLSVKTIETYRHHLKEKLALANGAELLRHAMAHARGMRADLAA